MNWPNLPASEMGAQVPELMELVPYLIASGWIRVDQDNRTSLWGHNQRKDDLRIVLPAQEKVTDYADRIYEALRILSYVERRTLDEVASDIVYGAADTIAVKLAPPTPSGQAPLSLAYDSVSALRNYVIGSGAALDDRSLVLPARRSRQAERYAEIARLSTLPGSFILSLSLPLIADIDRVHALADDEDQVAVEDRMEVQEKLVDIPSQPFGRRVANRMSIVARHAQSLAEEVNVGDQPLAAFGRLDRGSANATELEALSSLGGSNKDPYQMRFAQSPLASQRRQPTTLRITPGQQRIMLEAAEYLRTRQSRTGITVEGLVVNLSRNTNFGPGAVTIQGIADDSGKAQRFHVEVVESEYREALRAHEQGLQVVVRGDLDVRGTWKWIRAHTSFAVLPGLDYDAD